LGRLRGCAQDAQQRAGSAVQVVALSAAQPTILLLHGFPSSSHQFRELIPLLSDNFHVVAPDYPGMGYSEAPAAARFTPTFEALARVMNGLKPPM
jgi:pimeloyl-ACP methyl ester carboxylesterase